MTATTTGHNGIDSGRRVRVLFMPHHFRMPEDQGGLRSWHIVNQLTRFAHVEVVVPGVDTLSGRRHASLGWRLWKSEDLGRGARVSRVNALPNVRTSKILRGLFYISFSLLQFLRGLFMRRVDIVIVTSMPVSSMFLAWLAACRHRARFVIDVRDLPTEMAIELGYFRNSAFSMALLRLERFALRRADRIVTVSEGMARQLRLSLQPSRSVEVYPIGYDNLNDDQVMDQPPSLAGLVTGGQFVVLYSGTMGFVVDLSTVLEAARLTRNEPDIVYVFVGDGQRLEEYTNRALRDESRCVFLGRVPKKQIAAICGRADVCVYPLIEGRIISTLLGNKIFDYMGAGKPTLYTGPSGDVGKLIEDSGGGVCLPAGGSRQLAAEVTRLRGNPSECRRMGEAAREFVLNGLTAQETTGRMARMISDLAAR